MKVFSNNTKTEFRIGWDDEDFNMCSDESLKGGLVKLTKEEDVTNIQQKYGAITEYYDFRKDKYATKEEYNKHFENYNSDESYILPITTFISEEQANKCKEELLQYV